MVGKMMVLYCKSKHGRKDEGAGALPPVQGMLDYAEWKIRKCPFMEEKTFCSNCKCIA
ncbi:MAG: nitrous oxide-stimulated promoter family protein [Blautia faecis]